MVDSACHCLVPVREIQLDFELLTLDRRKGRRFEIAALQEFVTRRGICQRNIIEPEKPGFLSRFGPCRSPEIQTNRFSTFREGFDEPVELLPAAGTFNSDIVIATVNPFVGCVVVVECY